MLFFITSQADFIEKNATKVSNDVFMVVVDAIKPIEEHKSINSMKNRTCSCLQKELNELTKCIENSVNLLKQT